MNSRYITGLILITLGLIFFLCQFFDCSAGYLIGTYWPLIIVGIGLNHIIKNTHSLFNGIVLLTVGLLLLMSRLEILPWGFWGTLLPVALILGGMYLLLNRDKKHSSRFKMDDSKNTTDYVETNALFSGSKERVVSKNFKGGSVSAYFGGIELDLRNCEISPEGAYIEANAAFGGIEIFAPFHCKVRVNGTPFLGGIDNKTHFGDIDDDAPVITINAFVAFGGIDVRN